MHILLICAGQTYKAVNEAFLHTLRLSEESEVEVSVVSDSLNLAFQMFPQLRDTSIKFIPVELESPVGLGPSDRASSLATIAKNNAARIASVVAHSSFDIVELADTCLVGPYLKPALHFYGVSYKQVVLALKGGKSPLDKCLPQNDSALQELGVLLDGQFLAADQHYSLCPDCTETYKHLGKVVAEMDPWSQTPTWQQEASHHTASNKIGPVNIYLLDPTDPFSFEAIRWLPIDDLVEGRTSFRTTFNCGNQILSRQIIKQQAASRDLCVEEVPTCSFEDVVNGLKANSLVLATRQHPSIDLTLLKFVRAGVPVLMAGGCPTANFLRGSKVGHLIRAFDPASLENCADSLLLALQNWESIRRDASEAANLLSQAMKADSPLPYYKSVQTAVSISPAKDDSETFNHYALEETNWVNVVKKQARGFITRLPSEAPLRKAARVARSMLLPKSQSSQWRDQLQTHLTRLGAINEDNLHLFDRDVYQRDEHLGHAKGRCRVWAELARIERLCGNPLTAAAYDIRIMRASNADPFGRLSLVQRDLAAANLGHIAKSLALIVSPKPTLTLQELVPLKELKLDDGNSVGFEIIDDRIGQSRKVGVIVSLYKVRQDRVLSFIKLLGRQSLVQKGQVELILVDAGDSACARDLVKEHDMQLASGLVFARSSRRVTIQAAWNEGVKHARAPYLCFLGVDEALYPTALEELSQKLDQSPLLDWAMASSLVTEVDDRGQIIRDKAFFDRSDITADTTYLETCSVSWVGGMYRRSIHSQVGPYDGRFYAAGDTEFKMRALGALNVGFIPKTLGVFRDYPEARASGGVLAELEDTLAWYAYRSLGGATFTFRDVSNDRLEHLIQQCGGYRKCFSRSTSTDVNLGFALCHLLEARRSELRGLTKLKDFFHKRILEFRDHDFGGTFDPSAENHLSNTSRLSRINKQFKELTGLEGQFCGLNDNRYEQHNWIWPADAEPNPFNSVVES